ncbi:FadR/GntR family transcriptional regulator [Neoroseomonas lacus]|uniref:Transcriptional regulator n=1 Tax=Neoroseomonas lacus TaxID=287609 RepID=A0A917NXP6_9PROT|nr:FCD domain-containing protein [Neoroseomonas lacus]GGJ35359.1 transcriptional regulator [Neoroseomonas lacus]
MNNVVDFIRRNGLHDGDRLPPERELAEALGISRRALREQLTELELAGQLWRERRIGTVLGRRRAATMPGIDRKLMRASPDEILESRLTMEPAIAALAATKATEADLARIGNCMRRTAEVSGDELWVQWDGAFHLAIAEATRNDVLVALTAAFNAARATTRWRSMRVAVITPEKRRRSVAHHRAILDALLGRRPEEAMQAMQHHLLGVRSNLAD